MSVLFSPIGTADPGTHLGDGPMLHIVRHKRPNKVVLFLSPEMARHQEADGRYTKSIEHLARTMGFAAPSIEVIPSNVNEVYSFDRYITIFEEALENLSVAYQGEKLLVNVSSGTPAMEQALVALGSFGRLDLHLLQVLTPREGVNKRDDREDPDNYDLCFMADWVEEIEASRDFKSRIIEVKTPNFYDRVLRENVVALVGRYEYGAAYQLGDQMSLVDDVTKEMILAAAERLDLNDKRSARVFGGTPLSWKANDRLAEYLYTMEVRLEQGRWADYLRAMTPALTEIMKRVLERSGLFEKSYMEVGRDGKPTGRCDPTKIKADRRLAEAFNLRSDKPIFVTDQQYSNLVAEYCEDVQVKEQVLGLRRVEQTRNTLAHEIRSSTKEALEREGGMSMQEVFDTFVSLHDWLMPNQKMVPGLYHRISEMIIGML